MFRELKKAVAAFERRKENPWPLVEAAKTLVDEFDRWQATSSVKKTAYSRNQARERREKGLCRVCGRAPHRPDRTTCSTCAKADSLRHKRYYESTKGVGLR